MFILILSLLGMLSLVLLMMHRPFPGSCKFWLVVAGLISISKLFLVSGNEIIAVNSDAAGYIYYATCGYFGNADLPIRPFVYPVWLSLISVTGIPLRFIMEISHIASCGFLTAVLVSRGLPPATGILAFSMMVFHPFSFGMLNTTYSETLYSCLFLFYAGLVVLLFNKNNNYPFLLAMLLGCIFFLLWHTRDEEPVMVALAGITVLCGFAWEYMLAGNYVAALGKLFFKITTGVVVFLLLQAGIFAVNYHCWGTMETGQLLTTDEMSLLDTLTKIKPDKRDRYVQISQDMMDKAFRASPALQRIEPTYRRILKERFVCLMMPNHELNAACFLWLMKFTFSDASLSVDFYNHAIQELQTSLDSGQLPSRFCMGYIVPRELSFFKHFPESLIAISSILLRNQAPMFNPVEGIPAIPQDTQYKFDSIANRRPVLMARGKIRGWCFVEGQEITKISFCVSNTESYHQRNEIFAISEPFLPSPDVQQRFPDSSPPASPGFVTTTMNYDFRWNEINLILELKNRKPIYIFSPKIDQITEDYKNNFKIHYLIKAAPSYRQIWSQNLRRHQLSWGVYYTYLLRGLSILAAVALLGYVLRTTRQHKNGNPWSDPEHLMLFIWLGLLILIRILLYAVIDASFYPVPPQGDIPVFHLVGPRFLYPACILYPVFIVYAIRLMFPSREAHSHRLQSQTSLGTAP